jgi:hypothetical protein
MRGSRSPRSNGAPGIVAWSGKDPVLSVSLMQAGARIEQVLIVRNPDELTGLSAAEQAAT